MASTDVAQNKDTTGVVGYSGDAPTGTSSSASDADTTVYGGGGGSDNNKPATQPDTTAVQGSDGAPVGYQEGTVDQTVDTLDGGGSPIQQANPAYRAPSGDVAASVKDTTWTDRPISDGTDPSQTDLWISQNRDTVNPTYPLQTTSTNTPVAPATPTATAGPRSVTVTWAAVADPSGAEVRGYRIEGSTGGVTFAGRNATSVVVTDLVPSQSYKFRVAAYNDNGESPFSAYSNSVSPTNPDEPGPGHATGVTPANAVNPVYRPDGTMVPGTGGTPGPVGNLTATASATVGEVDVSWTAPTTGLAPTGYTVAASSGASVAAAAGATSAILTGLASGVPITVTVTPHSDRGDGVTATSAQVTPA